MQWARDGERWRVWLLDPNVRVLVWLTAALVMGILALNVWLIGQAITAARSVQFDAVGRESGAGGSREMTTRSRSPRRGMPSGITARV